MANVITALSDIAITMDSVHRFYMGIAYDYGLEHSHDPRTKLGAVIVSAIAPDYVVQIKGANHFSIDISSKEVDMPFTSELKRILANITDTSWKTKNIIHAEADAIQNAKNRNVPINGSTIYIPDVPCSDCVEKIIDAGIGNVICHESLVSQNPEDKLEIILKNISRLETFHVGFNMYKGRIGFVTSVYDGRVWMP